MSQKKEIRSDGTYIISTDATDNPKLGAKILSDGKESLFLDYYLGYRMEWSERLGREVAKKDRKREYLKLYLCQAPRTSEDRQKNKETLEIAKRVRFEKGQQLLEDSEGYRLKKNEDINFLDWMWNYYETYTKRDKRHIKRSCVVFADFLNASDAYRKYAKRLKPQQLDKDLIAAFVEYLQNRFHGEGPHTLYARFKKIVKSAVDKDVLRKNPCTGIVIKIDSDKLTKEVLSAEEMQLLMTTHYAGENPNIRRAFLFCLYSGLRWCDVKDLTYANVDFANRRLNFEQAKTKGHSSASGVSIPLNDSSLALIGQGKREEVIFPLPSHTMCLKALRHWTAKAGIDKHITWHCARHSFAVNILNGGANIRTVASLLGHSGLKNTEKYTRAFDSLKQEAINSLPELKM